MFSFKIKALQVLNFTFNSQVLENFTFNSQVLENFTFNSQVLEKVFPQIVQTQEDECVLKIMSC